MPKAHRAAWAPLFALIAAFALPVTDTVRASVHCSRRADEHHACLDGGCEDGVCHCVLSCDGSEYRAWSRSSSWDGPDAAGFMPGPECQVGVDRSDGTYYARSVSCGGFFSTAPRPWLVARRDHALCAHFTSGFTLALDRTTLEPLRVSRIVRTQDRLAGVGGFVLAMLTIVAVLLARGRAPSDWVRRAAWIATALQTSFVVVLTAYWLLG